MDMSIKEILLTQEAELLDIDLDCLEEQLETGDYDYHYVKSAGKHLSSNAKANGNPAKSPSYPKSRLRSFRPILPRRKTQEGQHPAKTSKS